MPSALPPQSLPRFELQPTAEIHAFPADAVQWARGPSGRIAVVDASGAVRRYRREEDLHAEILALDRRRKAEALAKAPLHLRLATRLAEGSPLELLVVLAITSIPAQAFAAYHLIARACGLLEGFAR